MTTAFRALVRKDLQIFFSDRRAVLMSIVAPIVIASFFGYIFAGQGGGQSEPSRMDILVIDQDNSTISRGIVAGLTAEKSLAVKPSTMDDARSAVQKGKAVVAIAIPKNFGADAGRSFFGPAKKPEVALLYDPSHAAELSMVQGILTGEVMQVVSKEMFSGTSGQETVKEGLASVEQSGLAPDDQKSLRNLLQSVQSWNARSSALPTTPAKPGDPPAAAQAGLGGGITMPYEVRQEAVTSGKGIEYNGYAHSFAGMGVQFILFMGIDMGVGLLLQRQRGLWKRLRAAPLSRGVLLGSRAFSGALIAAIILAVMFGFARVVFGVHIEGSFVGFVGVCGAFAVMTAFFGLLIAALGRTPEATRGLSIFAVLIMVMLGGAWIPTFIFPQWLQKLTVIVPTRWAVDGLDAMTWRGLGFSAAIMPISVLLGFGLLFAVLAVSRFQWEVDG
jgi:ABC-2 type transport system permease protein